MPVLEVKDLRFRDRGPYSFRVESSECVAVQGASGAGKSLLLRAIADLDLRSGIVQLGDVSIDSVTGPAWRRLVGMLPAESGWWRDLAGEHFAGFDLIEESTLAMLGFDRSVANWQVSRLSTGEKQRLAILRLLNNQPQCLLLDEPTASLDQQSVEHVEQLLLTYGQQHQAPILWVSHDPAQLARVSEHRLLIGPGGHLTDTGVFPHGR